MEPQQTIVKQKEEITPQNTREQSYRPDQIDLKLLGLLQQDGLLTYKELGRATHKTHSPIVERVSRLHRLGFIRKTVALLDIKKIRNTFSAMVMVELNNHIDAALTDFQQQMLQYPEVTDCYHVTGHYDFILRIFTTDIYSYHQFLRSKIGSLHCVGSLQSFPVLVESKRETAYTL